MEIHHWHVNPQHILIESQVTNSQPGSVLLFLPYWSAGKVFAPPGNWWIVDRPIVACRIAELQRSIPVRLARKCMTAGDRMILTLIDNGGSTNP
jgi:hypothetical protein